MHTSYDIIDCIFIVSNNGGDLDQRGVIKLSLGLQTWLILHK